MKQPKWDFSKLDAVADLADDKKYDERSLKKQKLFFYEAVNSYYQIIQASNNLIKEKHNKNISNKDLYFDYYKKFYCSKNFLQSYAEAIFNEPAEFEIHSKKVTRLYSDIEDESLFSGTTYWCAYYKIIADKNFKLKDKRYSLNEIRALIFNKKIIVTGQGKTNRYADEQSFKAYEKTNENKTADFVFNDYMLRDFTDCPVFNTYYANAFTAIRNHLSPEQVKKDVASYKNQLQEKIEQVVLYFDKKSKYVEKELAKFKFYIKVSKKALAKMKEDVDTKTIKELEPTL